jgi:hypothetical protein
MAGDGIACLVSGMLLATLNADKLKKFQLKNSQATIF